MIPENYKTMATLYYGVRANLVINGASTKHRGISRVIIHEKFNESGENSSVKQMGRRLYEKV